MFVEPIIQTKAKVTIKKPANNMPLFVQRFERDFTKIFKSMWDRQRDIITRSLVRGSIENYSIRTDLIDELAKDTTKFISNEFSPLYAETIATAGKEQARRIVRAISGSQMRFDVSTSRIADILKQKALDKAKELTTQQTLSLRATLTEAISNGWGTAKATTMMKGAVPLNERYTKAWLNYYDRLGNDPEISNAMLDYRTERYRQKLMTYRRKTIARTEINRAYNQGNLEAVQQAIDGKIVKGAYKVWATSLDERVRASHQLLEGERVKLDEAFPNGSMFPDDVNERCTILEELII